MYHHPFCTGRERNAFHIFSYTLKYTEVDMNNRQEFSKNIKTVYESGLGQVVYFVPGERGLFDDEFFFSTEAEAEEEMKDKLSIYVERELEPIYGHEKISEIVEDALESWKFQVLTRQEIEDLIAEEGYYLPSS